MNVDTPRRQLVVCCDGTSNTLTGGANDTNVLQLYEHLNRQPALPGSGTERLLYYDPGVGSPDTVPPTDPIDWGKRTWERLSGLASGRGVYDNIEQAYAFLMRHWQNNADEIYLFGFSRGAFTVRCVAGLIDMFGILRPEHEVLIPTLIRIYFSQPEEPHGEVQRVIRRLHRRTHHKRIAPSRDTLIAQVRQFASPQGARAWVHWVGVWDTVESVGLPGPLSKRSPNKSTLRNRRIRHVRQALSIDEHRWTYKPRLYEEPGDINDGVQTLRQVWYPGAHCDTGGSYSHRTCGLSDLALAWMVDEVRDELGIQAWPLPHPGDVRRKQMPAILWRHDPLWSAPWWALLGMTVRDMQPRVPSPLMTGHMVPMKLTPAVLPPDPLWMSVWDKPRSTKALIWALVLGMLCLFLSGFSLLAETQRVWSPDTVLLALGAAEHFAVQQLASLWFHGLLREGQAPWMQDGQIGWAMFWDFGFIASWGYVLARISSRAFHDLVGYRQPGDPMPAWRWLGMVPLVAVWGDVCENLLTLLAMAVQGMGVDTLAYLILWQVALASLAKWAGLAASMLLVARRLGVPLPALRRRPLIEAIEDDEEDMTQHRP